MNLPDKEFKYTEENFQYLKKKVQQLVGINLADTKSALVYTRISRLLRQYHIKNFDVFCSYLDQSNSSIEKAFINAITTNFTSFMREPHHFDYFREVILPEIIIRNASSKKIRIWSAGCSTGEEPYSISFVTNEIMAQENGWDVKILATDIDSDVLSKAQLARYSYDVIEQMPERYLCKRFQYFTMDDHKNKIFKVNDSFKKNIYFKQFNLMTKDTWPMHGPFDVIFCRNVLIYFDRPGQHQIIEKFSKLLSLNGYLILGHSESVPSSKQFELQYIDKTIYRRMQ